MDLTQAAKLAQHGDAQATRWLVEQAYPLVVKIVRAYVPRKVGSDDWVQDVLVRMLERLASFRGDAPFENWLSRLTVNMCLDRLRSGRLGSGRRRELRFADLGEAEVAVLLQLMQDSAAPGEPLAMRDLCDKLWEGIDPQDRVVLTMLDIEERTVAEVAEVLERGESWVKVRAMRARQKLRPILERLLSDAGSTRRSSPETKDVP